MIPVYKPIIGNLEKELVQECLNSTWISSKGKFISLFENEFSKYIGASYATSVSNGTVALHLALLALGIKEGDEVITSCLTYIATVNSIKYVGATPVLVDINENDWQINSTLITNKINKKTKAILVVHLYGHPCDMDSILEICKEYNLLLIEDCAEAIGSKYKNKHVGTFGDISTFSFYGNKTITTGEGGMVVTKELRTLEKIQKLKNQGVDDNKEYWHDIIGYNFRMTNICCALGYAQLKRIKSILTKKISIAHFYENNIDNCYEFHNKSDNVIHSYWMCTIVVPQNVNRENFRLYLSNNGIETRPVFYTINSFPMYFSHEIFPVGCKISERGVNLPSFPSLSKAELSHICKTINSYVE